MYDLIGDIHGERATLEALLKKLGYRYGDSGWSHAGRQAVFVGDFIDRGSDSLGVCRIVREMCGSASALAVMGNHEINALAFHTADPDAPGEYLRSHQARNVKQHRATLQSFANDDAALAETLEWFRTLPLWLDLEGLRVVHAAWHAGSMRTIAPWLDAGNRLLPESLAPLHRQGTDPCCAMETILKGLEVPLPAGMTLCDKEGIERSKARVRWWLDDLDRPWRDIVLGSPAMLDQLPESRAGIHGSYGYDKEEAPVFIGHYWLTGVPEPLAPNVACLDYSVAKPDGQLVSYRWDGETHLDPACFVSVARTSVPRRK